MSIIVKFDVQGMTAEKYGAVMRDLDAAGLQHPDGRSYHVSFGDANRLQVVDVYDSAAHLEAFGAKLMPILAKYGITARPEVLGESQRIVVRPAT